MKRFVVIFLLLSAGCEAHRPDARLLRSVEQGDSGDLDELSQAVDAVNHAEQGFHDSPLPVRGRVEDYPLGRSDIRYLLDVPQIVQQFRQVFFPVQ